MQASFKKNTAHVLALLFFSVSTLGVVGCGSQSRLSLNATGSNASGSTGTNTGTGVSNVWSNVDLQAQISGGPFDQAQAFSIDPSTQLITITLPLGVNPFGAALTSIPLTNIPGGSISLQQSSTGLWVFQVVMPMQFLVKGVTYAAATGLPNGSSLPGIPAGVLPQLTVNISNNNYTFYLYGSAGYFAVFFPTPGFNPFVSLTLPIMNKAKTKTLGYFATVAQQTTFAGGFYLALVFPKELQTALTTIYGSAAQ